MGRGPGAAVDASALTAQTRPPVATLAELPRERRSWPHSRCQRGARARCRRGVRARRAAGPLSPGPSGIRGSSRWRAVGVPAQRDAGACGRALSGPCPLRAGAVAATVDRDVGAGGHRGVGAIRARGRASASARGRAWLMRIHDAAGTAFPGHVRGQRRRHGGQCTHARTIAKHEPVRAAARHWTGRPRSLRHDDVVTTLWPAAKVAVVEQRTLLAQFPALLQAGDDRIADHYEVRATGTSAWRSRGRRAGGACARRHRYGTAYGRAFVRFAAARRRDRRAQRVLETSAFSDVVIGVSRSPTASCKR